MTHQVREVAPALTDKGHYEQQWEVFALDPHSSGFIVNQVASSNANVNGVTYLVWAIA